ncbi:MAG: tRNA pseudouridine(38-40) synthase TruA [Prevotellaceae bacterium]|nr:tRNA pseudouridine(38-40) synthase TruA [Prevotellaceae bacterium]
MQRYFLYIAYDGAAYHGWQIQPNGITVQERLMQALETSLRRATEVTGAGRTDTGVNASLMVAHFDAEAPVDTAALTEKLNSLLPADIAVKRIRAVIPTAHARFDATSRTYRYYLSTAKSPFRRAYSYRVFKTPDFELMNEAASLLAAYTDFTSFSKLHTDTKTNNCRVTQARWTQVDQITWVFTITADRFLRDMVRAIVGTLLEVGRGKLTLDGFRRVVEGRDRSLAGTSVPAHALFLCDISYPDTLFAAP